MHIVIIGNGIAGNTTASSIRQRNSCAQLVLISEETYPLYSACVLPHYLAGSLSRDRVFLKSLEDYPREGVTTILGERAEGIDTKNRQVLLSSQTIPYDRLVIATGGKVIIPPIKGLEKEGVFTFKSLTDADRVYGWSGKKAAVIGSGFIGVEVAIALRKRGYHVHIVELLDWILPRAFDHQPASLLKELLERNGIRVSVGERVNSIIGDTKVTGISTDKQRIECDTVILATGIKPNVELARKAGLKIGKLGGIEVDDQMMSSTEDIYACGDCVETKDLVSGEEALNLLWHNAKQQAEIAADNCLRIDRKYRGSINITGIDIFGTQAVSIGITSANVSPEKVNRLEVIERNWGRDYLRLIIYDGFLIGVQAINKIKDLGLLLSAILRKEDLKMTIKARNIPYFLWRYRISRQCGYFL